MLRNGLCPRLTSLLDLFNRACVDIAGLVTMVLKYLPKETLAQWALGSIAVAGAASVAYVLVFPSETPPPDLPEPRNIALTLPVELSPPSDDPAPEMRVAMAQPLADMTPAFDLVRITDTGDMLIAGKAPPTSAVSALVDEDPVAQAVSSGAGEFVMLFSLAPSPAPRILELEVRLPGGERVRSADTLMLAPSSDVLAGQALMDGSVAPVQTMREVEVAPLFPSPDAPTPQRNAFAVQAPVQITAPQDTTTLPESEIAADSAQVPRAILMRADGSVRILGEAPRLPGTGPVSQVVVDSVQYDEMGEVVVGGRAREQAQIQIYLDNQPILRTRAGATGDWQAQLDGIARGTYRLRIDELDEAAHVTSRAEIPFERVTPEIGRDASGPQALIVQPGNTLWGMSVDRFGDGRRYMRIFDANREQIRNPDLIFPGQVFLLPESDG